MNTTNEPFRPTHQRIAYAQLVEAHEITKVEGLQSGLRLLHFAGDAVAIWRWGCQIIKVGDFLARGDDLTRGPNKVGLWEITPKDFFNENFEPVSIPVEATSPPESAGSVNDIIAERDKLIEANQNLTNEKDFFAKRCEERHYEILGFKGANESLIAERDQLRKDFGVKTRQFELNITELQRLRTENLRANNEINRLHGVEAELQAQLNHWQNKAVAAEQASKTVDRCLGFASKALAESEAIREKLENDIEGLKQGISSSACHRETFRNQINHALNVSNAPNYVIYQGANRPMTMEERVAGLAAERDEWRKRAESWEEKGPKLEETLEDANGLCRSAYQIAKRGGDANWPAFTQELGKGLIKQHAVMFPNGELGRLRFEAELAESMKSAGITNEDMSRTPTTAQEVANSTNNASEILEEPPTVKSPDYLVKLLEKAQYEAIDNGKGLLEEVLGQAIEAIQGK